MAVGARRDRPDGAAVGRIEGGLRSRRAMVDAVALRTSPKQSNMSDEGASALDAILRTDYGVREFREQPLRCVGRDGLDLTAD
jgi:hypothetical protein